MLVWRQLRDCQSVIFFPTSVTDTKNKTARQRAGTDRDAGRECRDRFPERASQVCNGNVGAAIQGRDARDKAGIGERPERAGRDRMFRKPETTNGSG